MTVVETRPENCRDRIREEGIVAGTGHWPKICEICGRSKKCRFTVDGMKAAPTPPANDKDDLPSILSVEIIKESMKRVQGKRGSALRRISNRAVKFAVSEGLSIEEALAFVMLIGIAYAHTLTNKALDTEI